MSNTVEIIDNIDNINNIIDIKNNLYLNCRNLNDSNQFMNLVKKSKIKIIENNGCYNPNLLFCEFCCYGKLQNIIEYLNYENDIDPFFNNLIAFKYACNCKNLIVANWLHNLQVKHSENNIKYYEEAFINACSYNNIDIVKWLYNINNDLINSIINNRAFGMSCNYGSELPMWLYSKNNNINVSYNNEFAFKSALSTNNIELAEWLLSINPNIIVNINNEEPFANMCSIANLDTVKWFLKKYPDTNIEADNFKAFKYACRRYSNPIVAKWLVEIRPDILNYNDLVEIYKYI